MTPTPTHKTSVFGLAIVALASIVAPVMAEYGNGTLSTDNGWHGLGAALVVFAMAWLHTQISNTAATTSINMASIEQRAAAAVATNVPAGIAPNIEALLNLALASTPPGSAAATAGADLESDLNGAALVAVSPIVARAVLDRRAAARPDTFLPVVTEVPPVVATEPTPPVDLTPAPTNGGATSEAAAPANY